MTVLTCLGSVLIDTMASSVSRRNRSNLKLLLRYNSLSSQLRLRQRRRVFIWTSQLMLKFKIFNLATARSRNDVSFVDLSAFLFLLCLSLELNIFLKNFVVKIYKKIKEKLVRCFSTEKKSKTNNGSPNLGANIWKGFI